MEFSAKTVNDCITEACQKLSVTSDKLEYEVVTEGSTGFLGFNAKPAIIKARVKSSVDENVKEFLNKVFAAMNLTVVIDVKDQQAKLYASAKVSGKHTDSTEAIRTLLRAILPSRSFADATSGLSV